MAQRVQVILVCDLHGDETAGTETLSFAVDGVGYEIDVCADHAGEMRDAFGRYIGAARKASGRAGRRPGGSARVRRGRGGEAAQIRAWARGQGIVVPQRGRIPADIAERYAAANR